MNRLAPPPLSPTIWLPAQKAKDIRARLKTAGSRRRASNIIGDRYKVRVNELAAQLAKGQIDILKWQIEMRQAMREAWTLQLVAGAGGDKSKIDSAEYLKLGTRLKQQYDYLERFAADITAKNLSQAQIAVRSRMYVDAARAIYWQQITGLDLPAYPGDGSTPCLTACKCSWEIKYIRDSTGKIIGAIAKWVLGRAEHCPVCVKRASDWAALRVAVDPSKLSTAFKAYVAEKAIRVA